MANTDTTKQQTELLRQVRLALRGEDHRMAIASLEQLVKLTRQSGDVGAEGRHLGNLALIYYRLGQKEKALEYFEQALDRARKDEDHATENGLLGNMGNILRELGRYDEAIDYINRALALAHESGDVRGRGIWLSNLGLVYDDLKKPDEAIKHHAQAVEIARELQDQRGLAARLSNLGNGYVSLQDYPAALAHFEEAVSIIRKMGDQRELALRLGIMGNLHNEMARSAADVTERNQHFATALDLYTETLQIARDLGDLGSEAQLLRSVGSILAYIRQYEQAEEYYRAAIQLFAAVGSHQEMEITQQLIEIIRQHRETNPSQ